MGKQAGNSSWPQSSRHGRSTPDHDRPAVILGLVALLVAPGNFLTAQSAAKKEPSELRKELSTAGANLGVGLGKALFAYYDSGFPPSDIPPSKEREALEKALADYTVASAEAQGTVGAARSVSEFAVNGLTAGLVASGVGAVPAALVKAGGQIAADALVGSLESRYATELDSMLAAKKQDILAIAGVGQDQVWGKSPAELKARLENSTTVFAEMSNLMADDPKGLALAKDLIVERLYNTQLAALQQMTATETRLDQTVANLDSLGKAVERLREATETKLEAHEKAIDHLQGAVGELQISMQRVEGRLAIQERDGAIIGDFVFGQMPPGDKITALENGLFSERFACPGGGEDCEGAERKKELLNRFSAEKKLNDTVKVLGKTAEGLSDVAKIASNLGIQIEGLDNVLGVANVVVGAYAQFATGNPLGAVASVTSLFGQRSPDPDQVRFEAIQKQFAVVNKKLDAILENQQIILQEINNLAKQSAEQHRALDQRLARMEFEIDRVSSTVRQHYWQGLASCAVAHDILETYRKELELNEFDDFPSFSKLRMASLLVGDDAAACMLEARRKVRTLNHQWFGNFMDIRLAVGSPDFEGTSGAGEEYHSKSSLQRYLEQVHTPAQLLLAHYFQAEKIPASRALDLLVAPVARISAIKQRIEPSPQGSKPCGRQGYVLARIQPLICRQDSPQPELMAAKLIETPLLAEFSIDFADWMLLISRLGDIRNQSAGNYYASEKDLLAEAIRSDAGFGTGRELVSEALLLLDVGVASYSARYGDLQTRATLNALQREQSGSAEGKSLATAAKQLLKNNPYLAQNVAMLLLRERYAAALHRPLEQAPGRLPYRQALEMAAPNATLPFALLESLFGKDLTFEFSSPGQLTGLRLVEGVFVPLPSVDDFVVGRLVYPPRMFEMMQWREKMVDRLADYDFYKKIDSEARSSVVILVNKSN